MQRHPSIMWAFLFCVTWSWLLGILNAITFDWEKSFSYGQVLSLFAPIPALYSFLKIFRHNWRKVGRFFFKIPVFVSKGLSFVITGKQEWTKPHTELKRDYFHWPRWQWVISKYVTPSGLLFHQFSTVLVVSFAYNASHIVWIYFYVQAGTLPNRRNPVNQPHANWKPYSVMWVFLCFSESFSDKC